MGGPKHRIEIGGSTLSERVGRALAVHCHRVLVAGADDPKDLGKTVVADPPGMSGPAAGIVAAGRAAPWATLVVAACDLPGVTPEAVAWLLSWRGPEVWAVVPTIAGRPQPHLALFEPRISGELERLARDGRGPRALVDHDRVVDPEVPFDLFDAWRDVDTPEELAAWRRQHSV